MALGHGKCICIGRPLHPSCHSYSICCFADFADFADFVDFADFADFADFLILLILLIISLPSLQGPGLLFFCRPSLPGSLPSVLRCL